MIEYSLNQTDWSTTAPTIKEVSTKTVYVRATHPNYTTATCDFVLEVTPAPASDLHLTCPTTGTDNVTKWVYDGQEHYAEATATGISGTDDATEIVIEYSLNQTDWSTTAPTIKEVSTKTVYVRATHPNYTTATCDFVLEVTPAPASDLHLTCPTTGTDNVTKWVYDGQEHYAEATATGISGTDDAAEIVIEYSLNQTDWSTTAPTIKDAGTKDVYVRAKHPNYMTATCDFMLEITKKRLNITGNFTKMYDGTPFEVSYSDLSYDGLVAGEAFTSGKITTDGYQVGVYHCRNNQFLRMMDDLLANNSNFGPASMTANYAPFFDVTLEITVRPIVITAKSTTKEYDGILLTVNDLAAPGYDITSGSLATDDAISSISLTGKILCVGDSASKISNAVIMHGTGSDAEDVTDSYTITYVNGHLIVTPVSTSLVCPANLNITLWYGRCDTMVVLPAMATLTPAVDNTTIVNDLALQNPLPVGTHTITWSLLDDCGNEMQTCTQTVTVQFPPCEPVILDGRTYNAERIGCDCWTTENLRNEHYSDGTDIANFSSYRNSDSLENIYGKLYSWYSAVRVPEGNDTQAPADSMAPTGAYVQGICPQGWALPTIAEYQTMFQASGGVAGLVKSPSSLVWLPGKQGIAPNKFNAFGAGYYDANIGRYTDLLGVTHFWASDYTATSPTAHNFVLNYYCEDGLDETADRDFGFSIRCVQKK